jgi:hypothetical protein
MHMGLKSIDIVPMVEDACKVLGPGGAVRATKGVTDNGVTD